jgi:cytochrome c biogenesis protein CcmG/thiol:disulfide interchange protein DsbE
VVVVLVVAFMLYFGYHRARRTGPSAPRITQSSVAPDFSLESLDGPAMRLSDLRGKAVLLNFWATWCGPCKIEIPWFIDFEQAYKDRNFSVLGISLDDDGWDSVKPFVEQRKINYRVMIGTEEMSQQYGGVEALPTTFIIDRDGRIAAIHEGLVSKSEYQHDILNLLEQDGSKTPEKHGSHRNNPRIVPAFLRAK